MPALMGRRYAHLALREFRAAIPQHILAKLPEEERFLVETMSKLEAQNEWLMRAALDTNGDILSIDDRLIALETAQHHSGITQQNQQITIDTSEQKINQLWDWKQFFSGKWAILAALVLLVAPIILHFLFDLLMKHGKP